MTMKISPSDVILAQTLKLVLLQGRTVNGDIRLISAKESLLIMKFIHTSISTRKIFGSFYQFDTTYLKSIPSATQFLEEIHKTTTSDSIDDLIDKLDNLRTIFITDVSTSTNGLIAPTTICVDSVFGIYIRSILVSWESLSFEGLCELQTELKYFVSLPPLSPTVASIHNSTPNFPSTELIDDKFASIENSIEHLLIDQDISHAEDNLHRMFDSSAINGFYGSLSRKGESSLSVESSQIKHQLAMLSLATLWTSHGYRQLGFNSIEETMKIAHQIGDHATIAKCLLLLYYLLAEDQKEDFVNSSIDLSSSTTSFDEGILIRCLGRCKDSKFRYLAVQVGILLANLKIKKSLKSCYHHLSDSTEFTEYLNLNDYSKFSKTDSGVNLWNLLNTTMYGDIDMISNIVHHGSNTSSSIMTGSSKLELPTDSVSTIDHNEFCALHLSYSITCISLWNRYNQPGLAELQGRRAMRISKACNSSSTHHTASSRYHNDITSICCGLVRSVVDRINYIGFDGLAHNLAPGPSFSAHKRSELGRLASRIVAVVKDAARSATLSVAVLNHVRSTPLYVAIALAALKVPAGEGTLRSARRYREFFVDDYADAESTRADIVYARALHRVDRCEARKLLFEVSRGRSRRPDRHTQLEAEVLLAAEHVESGDAAERREGLNALKRLLHIARLEFYPDLECLIHCYFS